MSQDYQDQGFEKSLTLANAAISLARSLTPVQLHPEYRSAIRWDRIGQEYRWGWIKN